MIDKVEKILKVVEALREDVTAIKTDVTALQSDVTAIKHGQQNQGKRLEGVEAGQKALEAGQKTLASGQQALELKVETIHAYQKQTHTEIMEHLIDSNEVAGKAQRTLEEQVAQIKKHVGLPPLK
jgi:chromosome segregation ATPase